MDKVEVREALAEFREAGGRRLVGLAMPYRAVSESHREKFLPGSLKPAPRGLVHIRHDRSRPVSGWPGSVELRETDAGLEAVVTVDEGEFGDQVLEQVRGGGHGFSIEFNRAKLQVVNGIREVSEAVLFGLGITPYASYRGTEVQLRQIRPRVWIA